MTRMEESVWAALGRPPRHLWVPHSRYSAWRSARHALRACLAQQGVSLAISSWQQLWRLLHQEAPPPRAVTWGQLCAAATIGELCSRATDVSGVNSSSVASWNVRWLRDIHGEENVRKVAVLRRHLAAGRVALLQETHWSAPHMEVWRTIFEGCTLFGSCARRTTDLNVAGGVAILFPSTYSDFRQHQMDGADCRGCQPHRWFSHAIRLVVLPSWPPVASFGFIALLCHSRQGQRGV